MYSRQKLPINQFYKNVTKTLHSNATSLKYDSINSCNIRKDNFVCVNLLVNPKSIQSNFNKFPKHIKPKPSYNSESVLSSKRNIHQLIPKVPLFGRQLEQYRLSYYQDPSEYGRDNIETELLDFQNILDPANKIRIYQELTEEIERQMEQEKFDQNTSGPITWNIIR